jgi:hypothetical protein
MSSTEFKRECFGACPRGESRQTKPKHLIYGNFNSEPRKVVMNIKDLNVK